MSETTQGAPERVWLTFTGHPASCTQCGVGAYGEEGGKLVPDAVEYVRVAADEAER